MSAAEEVKQRSAVAVHEQFLQQGNNDGVRLAEVNNEQRRMGNKVGKISGCWI